MIHKKDSMGIAHQLIADSTMDTFPCFKLRDVSSFKIVKSFTGTDEQLYLIQISSLKGIMHSKRIPVELE